MNIYTFITSIALIASVTGCTEPADNTANKKSEQQPAVASQAASNNFEKQLQNYYRDFPYQDTYNYLVKFTGNDPARLNKWTLGIEPKLTVAGEDIVVRMNNDTYYKLAFIHLAKGPVVLTSASADSERFSSFQIMDDRNVNFRNVIRPEGKFSLYFGEKPEQLTGEAIESPSELVALIVRVEVKDKNNDGDTNQAKEIFNGITISGPEYTELPTLDLLSKYDEAVVTEATKRIDETFSTTPFNDLVAGLNDVPSKVSYLQLAAGTKGGWGGPITSHSAYETILYDVDGKEMKGTNGIYAVTTEEPPVDAFWSITVYDTGRGGFLHPNKHNLYHINNTAAVKNADGTVTLLFKQSCEETDNNCLEVPAGRFDLTTRYYLPKEVIRSGEWKLPLPELVPIYKANVPQNIITPDTVKTKYLGELNFVDGFPTEETIKSSYEFLDTSRGVQLFEAGMPTASMYAMLHGHRKIGLIPNKSIGITEQLMNARTLFLTPQTTTPYIVTEINVKEGPVVFDLSVPVIGLINDAYFKYVGDVGMGGEDKGKGGEYLIVGPDYKGDIPKGYFVLKTKTYRHWMILRLVAKAGQNDQAIARFKETFKMYPLSQANKPEANEFVNLSNKQYNTIHATDASFYDELNAVIQYEPANSGDPEFLGLAAAIGIEKGQSFNPDDRMKKILKEAAAIGNATGRAIMYKPRNKEVYFYPDRQWYSPLASGSHEFLDKNGARALDDRIGFHFYATGITPFMTKPQVGAGSVYEIAATDAEGNMLDGGKNYTVTLPSPIPARNFWSFMVYDNQTRSILETDQVTGGKDSNAEGLVLKEDGSAIIYFGPKAPKNNEANWVQTMPDKGFNVLLRLYGPEQAWFDKTWKPGDFELVE